MASSIRTTLILTVPAMAVMAACSDFLMALMGPEWEPAADVLKLLALVGIGKAIVFFTGPLLFAVARPHLRAVMLWALAAVSAGTVLLVGWLLTDEGSREQALGMAASRAAFFLAIVIPVNLAVVCWITGLRPRSFLPWLPSPLLSAAAGIGVVALLDLSGLLDGLPAFAALADRRHRLLPRRRGRPLRARAARAQARPARPAQAEAPGDRLTAVYCQPTEWSPDRRCRAPRCVLPTRWAGGSSAQARDRRAQPDHRADAPPVRLSLGLDRRSGAHDRGAVRGQRGRATGA